MKPLYGLLPLIAAITMFQTGIDKKGSFDLTLVGDKTAAVTSAFDVQKKGSFDITFGIPGIQKKGSFDLNGKDPEFPVTPN